MTFFGHKVNLFSWTDILQWIQSTVGIGGKTTEAKPHSEIRSDGPGWFAAMFSDEDEKRMFSIIRFLNVEWFTFIVALVSRLNILDKEDEQKLGTKGGRKQSFLVRLSGMLQKIVEEVRIPPTKKPAQGKGSKQQPDQNDTPQTQRIVRDDPRLTENDASVLTVKRLYELYRYYIVRYAVENYGDEEFAKKMAIDQIIQDLIQIGVISEKQPAKAATDAISKALHWLEGEGMEFLKRFDSAAIRLVLGEENYSQTIRELEARGTEKDAQREFLLREAGRRVLGKTDFVGEIRKSEETNMPGWYRWGRFAIPAILVILAILPFLA